MRARAWMEPEVDEYDELQTREASNVAARLIRTELPRQLDEKVIQNLPSCFSKLWYSQFNIYIQFNSVYDIRFCYRVIG